MLRNSPSWLKLFKNCSKETVTRMNARNRPQKIADDQFIKILPDQLSRFLQTLSLDLDRNDFEIGIWNA